MPSYMTTARQNKDVWYPYEHSLLTQATTFSSIDSDETMSNIPGPGRMLGLLLSSLGNRLESFMNKQAALRGLGPEGVSRKIRRLRRHDESTIVERHSVQAPDVFLSESEKRALRNLCQQLLKYTRAHILSTQLTALDEIIVLTIEDPVVRLILKECDLKVLSPKFREPDLIVSTSKALGSIENVIIHELWSSVISSQGSVAFFNNACSCDEYHATLEDPETSYLAARYLRRVLVLSFDDPTLRKFQSHLWISYIDAAFRNPKIIEWQNMEQCMISGTAKPYRSYRYSFLARFWDDASFKSNEQHFPEFFKIHYKALKLKAGVVV